MTFNEYYHNLCLPKHKKSITKLFHITGVLATLLYIVLCLIYKYYLFLFISPFIVYPFAWFSHLVFEKNKPAAFKNPIWAKAADIRMCYELLIGKISWNTQ